MAKGPRCQALVSETYDPLHKRRCSLRAIEGQPFCRLHLPEEREARRRKSLEYYQKMVGAKALSVPAQLRLIRELARARTRITELEIELAEIRK